MSKQALVMVGLLAGTGVAFASWHGREGRIGARNLAEIRDELGLSDSQVNQLRKLWTDQRKEHIRRRADLEIARLELRSLLDAPTEDERAVGAKVKELGELQASALKARVDARLAMRRILTPEQQRKLRELRPPRRALARPRGPQGRRGDGEDTGSLEEDGGEGESALGALTAAERQ